MEQKHKNILTGLATGYGTHVGSSVLHRIGPSSSGVVSAIESYGLQTATIATGAYLYRMRPEQKDLGLSLMYGGAYGAFLRAVAGTQTVRFSKNGFVKALQYILNGPAHIIGDPSIGYTSALGFKLTAGSANEDVRNILKTNAFDEAIVVLLPSIAAHRLKAEIPYEKEDLAFGDLAKEINFEIVSGPISSLDKIKETKVLEVASNNTAPGAAYDLFTAYESEINYLYDTLATLSLVAKFEYGKDTSVFKIENKDDLYAINDRKADLSLFAEIAGLPPLSEIEAAFAGNSAMQKMLEDQFQATFDEDSFNEENPNLSGYLAQPGFGDSGLSVSDEQFSPALPAPTKNSALMSALQGAKHLTASDLFAESCECPEGFVMVRVSEKVAKEAEAQGLGVDMGPSKVHSGQKVFAIESADGVYHPKAEREYGVSQGTLSPTRIQTAGNPLIESEGTLTRSTFTPLYG